MAPLVVLLTGLTAFNMSTFRAAAASLLLRAVATRALPGAAVPAPAQPWLKALPVLWMVGAHNVFSAAFTAFSPARLVFAATMAGLPDKEGELLRRMAPLAAGPPLLGMAALSPWGMALLEWLRPGFCREKGPHPRAPSPPS